MEITKLLATPTAVYVIDEGAGAVRKYDRAGNVLFSLATGPKSGGPLIAPQALAVRGDSLFVMDMKPSNGITIIDAAGRVVGHIDVAGPGSLSTLAATAEGFAMTNIGSESSVAEGTATLLSTLRSDGSLHTVGCTPDPIYAESLRKRGFLGLFRSIGVSAYDGRLYCRQPVSPVVQVFAFNGDPLPAIALVPPFYRMGPDAPQSMNQLTLNQFTSTWTEHLDFHPFARGFLSVYARFDLKQNARVYSLFRCIEAPGSPQYHCATADMLSRPLAFVAPDTVVTVEISNSSVTARLSSIR